MQSVLLVDDDPSVLSGLRRTLFGQSMTVHVATSADAALEVLEEHDIHVVVSDERMPGMSGSELLAVVRKQHPNAVRLILTGQATREAAIRAINEGGVHRYLLKPCDPDHFVAEVKHALQYRKLLVELHRLTVLAERQGEVLQKLEESHPGITAVHTNAGGAIVVDEEALDGGFDEMLEALFKET